MKPIPDRITYRFSLRLVRLLLLMLMAFGPVALAQQAVSFMKPEAQNLGWSFNNGPEFPGAKGSLDVDSSAKQAGQDSLKLTYDFTGGGTYVQASTSIDGIDIRELSFSVKNLQRTTITVRIVDSVGRCHQFNLKTEPNEGWQRVVFPLEQFFANQGKASALTIVSKYEAWGGEKGIESGKWNGPAKLVAIVLGKQDAQLAGTVWINGTTIIPRPAEAAQGAAGKTAAGIPVTLPLDEVMEGEIFWEFSNGPEFAGAKGELALVKDEPAAGQSAMKLVGDFAGGGLYVAANKTLDDMGLQDVSAFRMKVKADNTEAITVRVVDGTGQTFQKKGVKVISDGKWHELVLEPALFAGGEHWAGANDGKWHGAPKGLSLMLTKPDGENKVASLMISDIKAEALLPAKSSEAAFAENFEREERLPEGWLTEGAVTLDTADAFKGKHALVLEKTEKTLRDKISAASPAFPVQPGAWEVQFAAKTDLESMDNSYNGSLALEFLDGAGKAVGGAGLADLFRKNNWKPEKKPVEVPSGAVSARFVAKINKETPGKFWIDELSASAVIGERKDDRIRRLMFGTAQLGNLLFPEDSREITVEVWATKPLLEDQRKVSLTVRDYWGAEQARPLMVELQRAGKKDKVFRYEGKVDLASVPLEIGRYYELHGSIERKSNEPFTNYTSLAILPEAPANSYKPEEVPFTSRNWDNRFAEYVKLTNRLGIRICGVWGKMDPDPKKVEAPQIELVEKLGMGYLTGSPAHEVEQRSKDWKEKYNEAALRQGVRSYFEKYGKLQPVIVNLGNEPHSKGEDVKVDVEAYRIVYTEIKRIDPTIFVVGTSIGASEDYFKAGFGQWCDAYDFHVYEDALSVRNTISKRYPEMFRKYGYAKPVWSTELGLNSQGMARQFVAAELYRKFVNFFAGGGANVSWFGLLYPDPEGKNADSFSSAHNVFDCRYSRYAPKLDAIAYYNAVNAIAIKKFVEDKIYGDGSHAFLFRDRDNKALQVWYTDKGREDLFIPLSGVNEVHVIRIDGTRSTLHAGGMGVTLTISADPLLLLYEGGDKALPEKPGPPAIRLGSAITSIVRGEKSGFDVVLENAAPDRITLKAPPFWEVKPSAATDEKGKAVLRYSLGVPENSTVREANLTVVLKDADGRVNGEISYRPAVTGAISMQLLPVPVAKGKGPAVRLVVRNNSREKQQLSWDVALNGEQELKEGTFTPVAPTGTYFAETASGSLDVEGKKSAEVTLPLVGADLFKVYRTRATARDSSGRVTAQERPVSAFYGVPKAKKSLTLDGTLDEEDWKNAPVRMLDKSYQFYAFQVKEMPVADWKGPEDLSAEIRYLWDDDYFYVSVKVADDIASKVLYQDGDLWRQDGLQFLIDPMRTSDRKIGKYEYSVGVGNKGSQTWCTLSADAGAPAGDAKDIKVAVKKGRENTGDITYEIAFPWSRLAPFKPGTGNDLGFTLIINEDDGNGRDSFMTWFGNAHSKDVDTVGDLILTD